MARQLTPDICVIGAGAGGLSAAAAAAAFGVPVVLIEKNRMGGESLNNGSLPSKALIVAAEHADMLRNGAPFGVRAAHAAIDFTAIRTRVHEVIDAVAPQDSRERFVGLGVRVIPGAARFTDSRTVMVDDIAVKARRFIVATGSSPAVPAIPGLADAPHLTNETVFDLDECPRHLIVIGAGSVGLALAQAFRRLGAEVTVVDASTPLASNDPECAAIVLDALERDGIKLRAGVKITRVRRVLARVQVVIATPDGEESIEGTDILIAAGRRPNVERLNLDAAGIRYGPRGIVVDKRLRTTNKHVYAIGDVTGGPKFTHLAQHHAGLAVRHALFRLPVKVDHHAVPSVTYTDPELAQVGLLEDEARAHSGIIRILRWPYRENDRAQTTGATGGHIKIITDRKGDILGATIVGAQAGENIAAWTLAIKQRLNIRAFAGLIVPYPSYAEVGKRAAITYFMRGLTNPRLHRIMGWLRRLG
jgi:pyruvate/2-oxoglutarate dehydrogenase complex dihydrolipoamide dehydrogenase (E3) component